MMRYVILLALLLCLPIRGEAWQVLGVGGGGEPSVQIETFDSAGYDLSGWVETGSPNEDCSTSPCPLVGTQSLSLIYTGSTKRNFGITGNSWWEFIFLTTSSTNGGDSGFFYLYDSSDALVASVLLASDNTLRVRNGSSSAYTTTKLTDNTAYRIRVEYERGTGSDGKIRLSMAQYTGSETLVQEVNTTTGGTSTTDATTARMTMISSNANGSFIFDDISGGAL